MQRMGLSAAEFRLYSRGLARTHQRRVVVQVLNLEGRLLGTLPQAVIGGQVTVNATEQPVYDASVDLFDPNRTIAFEPEVTDLSVHMSRMIRIIDQRLVPTLGFWVGCRVFTGPLSKPPKRDGAIVTIEADDKSVLAMGQARGERVFPKGTDVKRVLSEMLRDTGETDDYLSIAPGMGKLGNKRVVARFDQRWLKARKLAKSRNRQLFYNGAGVAIARRSPQKVQWTVPPAAVLSPARIDREATDVKNVFRVVGGKPKGKNKKRIVSSDYPLPKTHPDNPARLGRNGTPRYLYETEENDDIKRKSVADSIARRMRNDAMRRSVSIDVDIAPMPHIEPYDLIRVVADNGTYQIRALQFSLPLFDGVMSLGTKRAVSGRARGGSNRGGGSSGHGGKSRPSKGRDYRIGAFPR